MQDRPQRRERSRQREGSGAVGGADRTVLLLLLLAVLAGAALRFHGLDAQSLWNDELSSWEQSSHPTIADVIRKGVRTTTYPPAYAILIHYVERYVGDSEKALRLPSAIAGVLAIAAMYFLGRQLYSRREGLIAAALVAFSYQPIYYSQEARCYSLLLLFSILTSHFWYRITSSFEARESPSIGSQVGYVACAIFTIYLHYFGLLLVAIQLAGLLALYAARPRQLARAALLTLAVAVSYVPWIPYFFEEFEREEIHLEEPGLHTLAAYWRFLFYNPGEQLKWFAAAVFVAAAVVAFARQRGAPRLGGLRARLTAPTTLLAAWLVLPVAFAYIRSKVSLPIMDHRNLIISLPAAFLLFSRALTTLVADVKLQAVTTAAMIAIMLHGLFVTGGYYRLPRKEQFREAAAVVAEREGEFPGAVVIAHTWTKRRFDYYLERLGASSRVDLKAGTAEDVAAVRALLAARRPSYVWFLLGHRQPDPVFMGFLDRELELVFHVPLYGAFARLYREREPERESPAGRDDRRGSSNPAPALSGSQMSK